MKTELIIVIIIISLLSLLMIESFVLHFMMKSKMVFVQERRFIIGVVFAVLAYFLVVYLWGKDGMIWPVLVASGLGFLNLAMYNFPRVSYDDYEIKVVSFPLRKRKYTYADITGIKWGKNGDFKLFFGKNKLYVDETAEGNNEFLRQVFQKREEQLHQRIPEITDKLFHGRFINAKELLIAYMLLPLFATGGFLAIILSGKIGNYPQDMNSVSTRFDTCVVSEQKLILSNNDLCLRTRKCNADTADAIREAVAENKTLMISYQKSEKSEKTKDGIDGIVWSLSDGTESLITAEETLRIRDESTVRFLWIIGISAAVCWIAFFFICVILNNAPRYKSLVKLLVKEENWRF